MESNKTFNEFQAEGLLWALNRYIFHPRGLAIQFTYIEDEVVGWGVLGDGKEVWAFDDPTDDSGFERFNKFLEGVLNVEA